MNDQLYLVTTSTFKGKYYLVKIKVNNGNSLDVSVKNKYTSDDWECTYNAACQYRIFKKGSYKITNNLISPLNIH